MPALNRAMDDTQKHARRADILRAALRRFADTAYDALSMNSIAADTGLAKGTLYLYFTSKETLFLALFEQETEGWFDDLDAGLKNTAGSGSIESLLRLISESFTRRPLLLRLIAILHTVLERNVDYATALRFKTRWQERARTTGALLEQHLPFLEAGQGAQLLLRIDALVIGFQHLAEPSDTVRQVLARPDMTLFRVTLESALLDTLRTLLLGLAYEARMRQERQHGRR